MALLLRTWVPLGCTTRGFEMCWGRRADFAEWDRGRCSFRSRENWSARRCRAGTVSRAMFSQWCQRRLCCREPCGADGRLVGLPRAVRGNTCRVNGVRRRWTPPCAAVGFENLTWSPHAALSPWHNHRDFCWRKSKFKEAGREASSEAVHAQSGSTPRRQRLPGDHGRAPRGSVEDSLSPKSQERELSPAPVRRHHAAASAVSKCSSP